MVTAAPYTNQRVWGDIMEATVDPTTGRPMLARMFAQLYGGWVAAGRGSRMCWVPC